MKDELEPYKTSDTPLAAYLHFRGMVALTTKPDENDRKRKVFIFVDQPERVEFEKEWDEDVGGHRSYFTSLKIVQHMLYPPRNSR